MGMVTAVEIPVDFDSQISLETENNKKQLNTRTADGKNFNVAIKMN